MNLHAYLRCVLAGVQDQHLLNRMLLDSRRMRSLGASTNGEL